MKLKELIEKFEERKTIIGNYQGYAVWWKDVKEIFEQLDEPKPVKVPQFVADFIAEQKKLGYTLSYSIDACMSDIVAEWYWDNSELFALAWIFGYEVEEEKRYLVKMKGIVNALSFLSYHKNADIWTVTDKNNSDGHRAHHTRKQLEEAGFGWVFDCEGIEIEEVE
ncbi:DUF1642 domain-containing protein [Streptococcus oralis]|uniref:DUF1642 domain-containing protein n=1 Tax=Streptococcus oralis TaxID=1303 RepID=UPI0025571E6E|nr:DUF1642 domain-containing protein [Streptococcus oralis]MDK7308190.1 DUF1642 domain-containing protein [Streptococcus oralis]MDK7311502.1 DUF1642 domain-containing protein [Streptococcus oralis]MDK7311560.1 DUF1642 domain-containing protein [Streptococcus oralis]